MEAAQHAPDPLGPPDLAGIIDDIADAGMGAAADDEQPVPPPEDQGAVVGQEVVAAFSVFYNLTYGVAVLEVVAAGDGSQPQQTIADGQRSG